MKSTRQNFLGKNTVQKHFSKLLTISYHFYRTWRGTTPEFVHSLMSKDFPSLNSKPIHYYYGLNHFIILGPAKREREDIDNETRSKMALSTVAVALNNTRCPGILLHFFRIQLQKLSN